MLRIVFLCSGGGGNLRFVFEAIRLGVLKDAGLCGVVSDRECPASLFAVERKIPMFQCDFSGPGQSEVLSTLSALDPDIVVTNVHKILTSELVARYSGRLVNLHYSLLPAFGGVIGVKPVSQALTYGARLVGTTVHLVDSGVDTGAPVVQAAIPVMKGEALPALMDVVFRAGCMSLLTAIQLIRKDGAVSAEGLAELAAVSGRSVLFNPPVPAHPLLQSETFWSSLK